MSEDQPVILPFRGAIHDEDPIVITGIGLGTSLGSNREQVWNAIQTGQSGIRMTTEADGLGPLRLACGMVDWLPESESHQTKALQLTRHVAQEAIVDARIDWSQIDRDRFACSIAAQFGNIGYCTEPAETRDHQPETDWYQWFLPCMPTDVISQDFGLYGPRLCHTTACASGLVSTIAAARAIRDDQADIAICGASDSIAPLVIAAFHRMGVLSDCPDAARACRPFDVNRSGFVMGEGAALMVLERKSHALRRGAKIYTELAGSHCLCQAHHVTGLDSSSESLQELIAQLLRKANWRKCGVDYINAHGTGTAQNDVSELQGIRGALGTMADQLYLSSSKAAIGHLINASSSVELALTALAMRDGYAPPTLNLDTPEAVGNLDCLPHEGVRVPMARALKLSLAFGGHLVGMALRQPADADHRRPPQPLHERALLRRMAPAHDGSARRAA